MNAAQYLLLMQSSGTRDLVAEGIAAGAIAIWMGQESAGTVMVDSSGNSLNGTYTGVTLQNGVGPFGLTVPTLDGVNDAMSMYSAAYAAALDLDEGCIVIWVNPEDNIWSDNTDRYILLMEANGSNQMFILKTSANQLRFRRQMSGGTAQDFTISPTETGVFSVSISWSVTGDSFVGRLNGAIVGSGTGLSAYDTGVPLNTTRNNIGSFSSTGAVVWNGAALPALLFDQPENAAIIAIGTP